MGRRQDQPQTHINKTRNDIPHLLCKATTTTWPLEPATCCRGYVQWWSRRTSNGIARMTSESRAMSSSEDTRGVGRSLIRPRSSKMLHSAISGHGPFSFYVPSGDRHPCHPPMPPTHANRKHKATKAGKGEVVVRQPKQRHQGRGQG